MIGKVYDVPPHQEPHSAPERVHAKSEAKSKAAYRRWARMREAVATIKMLLDAGYVTVKYKKGHKLSYRNIVSITATAKAKPIIWEPYVGRTAIRTIEYGLTAGLYEWYEYEEERG